MRKRKKIIFIILIAILLFSVCFVGGGTYAKYVAKVTGKGIATVAKWEFIVNGQTDTIQNIQLASTGDENLLRNGKIAPGTSGSFDILIDTTGADTAVVFFVEFQNETTRPKNLVFETQGRKVATIKELEQYIQGMIEADQPGKQARYTVRWTWAYETGTTPEEITKNDKLDTQDALALEQYSFDIVIRAEQAEPRQI